MELPSIVGVTGTNGAGKDSVASFLAAQGYFHVSLSDILRGIADERGLEHSRANLSSISQEIRTSKGDGAMVVRALDKYLPDNPKICFTSVRTPGEASAIKAAGGVMIWVDADSERRYQRVMSGQRNRGQTDAISFEEFLAQEANEMTPSKAGGGLNMLAVRNIADLMIENNYDTLQEFDDHLAKIFTP